ncbi:LysR substrate-binding domain-containing protein, partial [Pseudomonas sp. SIMBA_044]
RLSEFLAQHPSLDIDILLDDRVIDVVAEGIDIALRMGALSDSSAVARKLATGARSVVASPDYLARTGMAKIPADLVNHHA